MKKFLIAISCALFALLTVFSMACGKSNFTYTDMLNPGEVKEESLGGFAFETSNYVYFINGEGKNTEDNTFGAPTKGSLVAVEKSELGNENAKYSIVIPKLFVAQDYSAGLFVSNGYVYYGTPCTDKDSSGSSAYNYMTFMRTSLDGKNTDTYLTVSSLDTNYRFVENGGVVYIVYYDSANSQIVSYNTADKSTVVVAKTDAKTKTAVTIDGATYYLSMSAYKFAEGRQVFALSYVITVYSENYYEQKAEKEDYSRKTANFNILATYTPGDAKINVEGSDFYGKLLKDAKSFREDAVTYSIVQIQKGATEEFVFVTKTDVNAKAKTYGVSVKDFNDETKWVEVEGADKVSSSSILVNLEELYHVDAESSTIYKTTLSGNKFNEESKLATESSASKLLFIDDGYIFYFTSGNQIACYEKPEANKNTNKTQISVSEDIVLTTWYLPELVKTETGTFVLYCDSSSQGASYIKCVNVKDKSNVDIENEDGTVESREFDGHVFMGIRLDKDVANNATIVINQIESGVIDLTENNGELISVKLNDAINAYDKLTPSQKEFIEEDALFKIEEAKQVVKLANLYNKLKGVEKYSEMNDAEKTAFKAQIESAYIEAKAFRQELLDSKTYNYISIRDRVSTNLKFFYQEADKIFTANK